MNFGAFATAVSQLASLIGPTIQMVQVIESAVPAGTKGSDKLAMVKTALTQTEAVVQVATPVIATLWPILEQIIAGASRLSTRAGSSSDRARRASVRVVPLASFAMLKPWPAAGARRALRAAAVAALFILASSCGGSGSTPASGAIIPVTMLRADLKFGYWAGELPYIIEESDHVNLWWARDDKPSLAWHLAMAEQLQAARGANIRNLAIQLPTSDTAQLRFYLGRLSEGGYFNGWDSITLYGGDEPERFGLTDAQVAAAVTAIRQIAFDTPGLLGAKVGIFYGCENGKRPGIKSYDFVGCFRYESDGCAKLEGDYAALRAQKAPGAQLWLIPGGATIDGKNGRQDPACWASYAHRNADVWGIVAFMWQSVAGSPPVVGIREPANGMRKLYCETGRVILKPTETPRC
jgi:hypothetical protein